MGKTPGLTVKWYQFIIPSALFHAIMLGLCAQFIPDECWPFYPPDDKEITQNVIFRDLPVMDWPIEDHSVEIPEDIAPDEDPFEPSQEPISGPDISFDLFKPADLTEETEQPERPNLEQPKIVEQTENLEPSPSFEPNQLQETPVQPVDAPSHPNPLTKDGDISQNDRSGHTQTSANTGLSSNALSQKTGVSNDHADETEAWRTYTAMLSAHFKKSRIYPEMARRLKLTGTVWIELEIRRDGKIMSARVAESSGVSILDESALDSAQNAGPVPAFPNQVMAKSRKVRIPYQYKIR